MESKVMQVVPLFEPTLPGHQNDIVGFTYHIYIYIPNCNQWYKQCTINIYQCNIYIYITMY